MDINKVGCLYLLIPCFHKAINLVSLHLGKLYLVFHECPLFRAIELNLQVEFAFVEN